MRRLISEEEKRTALAGVFRPLIGDRLSHFETAQMHVEGEGWTDYPDYPIRFHFVSGGVVSLSWSHFDYLWISTDLSVPFQAYGFEVRWQRDSPAVFTPLLGATLHNVALGQHDNSIGGVKPELWTRVLLRFDAGWADVFNALDETGLALYDAVPEGPQLHCL